MVPYTAESFWVNLKNNVTNCDYVYVQCYEGGAGNDPSTWKTAMGSGVVVIGGQEGNTATPGTFRTWYLEDGVPGGFYFADGIFNTTYWSAAMIEANGAIPPVPTGLTAVPGGQQVGLSWNVVLGAISYNVKRSTVSGGETNIANVSTFNVPWPGANQYFDTGLASGTTYYYKVSAVNTNGESLNSAEVSAVPQPATVFGFETPAIGLGNYQYSPSGGPWTFNGTSPNGSGIVANGSGFGNPPAPEGVQAAFVQELGTVSQSIAGFVPGTNYTITFSAAERGGNSQSWNVEADNNVIGSYNPGSSASSYADYTATFTATAVTHVLSFVGTDLAGGDNTVFIDNVRITPPLLTFSNSASASLVMTGAFQTNSAGNFTPTWTVAPSLIAGASPIAQSGNFTSEGNTPGVSALTDGVIGPVPGSYNIFAAGGSSAGNSVTYALPVQTYGYDLTNITVYSGWGNGGRVGQAYTVLYSTVANPTIFIVLTNVSYSAGFTGNGPNNPISIRVQLSGSTGGIIASNVAAIQFNFYSPSANDENGGTGYSEITVQGNPAASSSVVASPVVVTGSTESGSNPFTPIWRAETPNLIAGLSPTIADGDFTGGGYCSGTSVLTDGAIGVSGNASTFAACGYSAGTTLIYTLTNSVNGSDVTNIVVYSGWADSGRFGQYYILSYSTVSQPSTYIPITTVFYLPADTNGTPACRVAVNTLTGAALAKNVSQIKFDFASPSGASSFNNAWQGYSEIVVQGTNSAPPLSTNALLASLSITPAGTLNPAFASGTTGYTVTNSYVNNLVTVAAASVDANATLSLNVNGGGYGASVTNSLTSEATSLLLNPPVNTVAVQVVSQDLSRTNTYTVNVLLQPSQTVLQLTNSVSGSTLTLNWPADHVGWRLQVQTNSVGQGLGTNWVDVVGATATNQMIMPIKTANGSVFYRMIYP
jgi:hypothetical protein